MFRVLHFVICDFENIVAHISGTTRGSLMKFYMEVHIDKDYLYSKSKGYRCDVVMGQSSKKCFFDFFSITTWSRTMRLGKKGLLITFETGTDSGVKLTNRRAEAVSFMPYNRSTRCPSMVKVMFM